MGTLSTANLGTFRLSNMFYTTSATKNVPMFQHLEGTLRYYSIIIEFDNFLSAIPAAIKMAKIPANIRNSLHF